MWSSCLASGLGTVTAELPLCSCARPPHRLPAASPGTQLPSWPGAQRGCSRPPQALLCWASVLAPPAHSHPTPWPWVSGTRDGHSGPGLHPSSLPQALWPRGQRVGSSVPLSAPALQGDCETSQASTCTSPPQHFCPTMAGWASILPRRHRATSAAGQSPKPAQAARLPEPTPAGVGGGRCCAGAGPRDAGCERYRASPALGVKATVDSPGLASGPVQAVTPTGHLPHQAGSLTAQQRRAHLPLVAWA